MPRFALLSLALVLPGALLAQCPTSGDLAGGIAFTGADGSREVFTDIGGGMVMASYRYPDGYTTLSVLARGMYLVDFVDGAGRDEETRTHYRFPMPVAEMPLPGPIGRWDVEVSIDDGTTRSSETQAYKFGPTEQLSFGACSYDAIPVIAEFSSAAPEIDSFYYLPALGLSYFSGYEDANGRETYVYDTIEALP